MDMTKAIEGFPVPRSVHEVRCFLGLTGYFCRFIPNYACIAKPLSDLLKKDLQFVMGEKQLKSSRELRQSVLAIYNRCHEMELHTDASTSGRQDHPPAEGGRRILPPNPLRQLENQ